VYGRTSFVRFISSLALAFLALGTAARADAPQAPPTVETYYRAAINAMDALKEPAYVTYTMHGDPQGLAVKLIDRNSLIWLGIHDGSDPSTWQVRHRTDDYASELLDVDGTRWVSMRSFFDPTWWGAFRALRDGMLNYQVPEAAVSARATPAPDASSKLHVIATVTVMGPAIYQLQDRGAATCPSGSPGHAIHLIPRDRDPKHQLNDVVIELTTRRFCMVRYGVHDSFGFHGIVEQHYSDVGGYWVQTDGFLDGTLRVFGIATHHGKWFYRLDDIAFPKRIPSTAFITPYWQ